MHRMDVSLRYMYIILHFSTYIYTNTVFTTVGINKPGPCEKAKEKHYGGKNLGARRGGVRGGGGEQEERTCKTQDSALPFHCIST